MTVMGDALRDRLSDAGSTPARSIYDIKQALTVKRSACFLFVTVRNNTNGQHLQPNTTPSIFFIQTYKLLLSYKLPLLYKLHLGSYHG